MAVLSPILAHAQDAPGGVSTGITVWYDAGTGIPQNTVNVTANWAQRAGSAGESLLTRQGTTGTIDTVVGAVNFNPALDHNNPGNPGTGRHYSGPLTRNRDWITPFDTGSAFGVGGVSDMLSFLGRGAAFACASAADTGRCDVGFRPDGAGTNFGGNPSVTAYASAGNFGPVSNVYGLWSSNGVGLHRNTRNGWTNSGPGRTKEVASDYQFRIGSFPAFTADNFISEVVYYGRKVTETEAQQITTYLGVKYGVTLDGNATRNDATNFNYLSSSGVVVWAGNGATLFNGYHRNVFGLGRDSALDQRIATNINDSGPVGTFPLDILTLATGTLSAPSQFTFTHQSSGSQLAQGQYLMVGNDNGSTTTVTAAAVTDVAVPTNNGAWSRLTRRWRAQNTGAVGTVSLRFNVPAAGVTALGGNLSNVVLLVDDDGNYTNGGTRIVTTGRAVSGNQISFNETLANGEIFTLAFNAPTIRIDKTTVNAAGTYTFNLTNTAPASGSVTMAASATTSVDTNTVLAGVQAFAISTLNTNITVTEATLPANIALMALTCVNTASGGTPFAFTVDLATRTATIPAASVHAGAQIVCTFTNTMSATLRIVKSVPTGQGTAFDFSQSGMPTSATGSPNASAATAFTLNPSVVAGSNLTATQTYTNVPSSTQITVNELKTASINQYSLVNIVCTNAAGAPTGSTFPTSINNAAASGSPIGTATVTLVAGADVTCTFNNVRNPRIVIVKNTVGGDGTFSFTETSTVGTLSPSSPISLVTSGGSATVNTMLSGLSGSVTSSVTITEALTTGFTLTSVSCTNLTTSTALTTTTTPSATVTLADRQVVLGAIGTGSEVQCTFSNTRNAQLQLRKTWVNARINDAVNIPATSGFAANTAAFSSVANTANESDSGTAVSVLVGATGSLPTETFTTGLATNYTTTGWVCTDGGSTLNVAQGGSLVIPASSAGITLVCTLTNTRRQATLALSKVWSGAVVNDTANLQGTGGTNTAALASVASAASETDTGTAVAVFAGDVITLSETLGSANVGLYSASAWSCTGTSGLSGAVVTVAGADTAVVCSITNSRQSANLSITKASTTSPVTAGGTISYSIVVTNNGPFAANNAIVSDDWTAVPGLNCNAGTATCTASGAAGTQCPAPASVTPAGLQAGLAIPVLPSGGIVSFTLQCAVTATGQ